MSKKLIGVNNLHQKVTEWLGGNICCSLTKTHFGFSSVKADSFAKPGRIRRPLPVHKESNHQNRNVVAPGRTQDCYPFKFFILSPAMQGKDYLDN